MNASGTETKINTQGPAGGAAPAAPQPHVADLDALLGSVGVGDDVRSGAVEWTTAGRWTDDHAHRDQADRRETDAELRKLYGAEYRDTVGTLRKYLRQNLPARTSAALLDARDRDGRALFNRPDVVIKFAALAKRATLLPPSAGDVDADITAIQSLMQEDEATYRADPGARLRLKDLLSQREMRKA